MLRNVRHKSVYMLIETEPSDRGIVAVDLIGRTYAIIARPAGRRGLHRPHYAVCQSLGNDPGEALERLANKTGRG